MPCGVLPVALTPRTSPPPNPNLSLLLTLPAYYPPFVPSCTRLYFLLHCSSYGRVLWRLGSFHFTARIRVFASNTIARDARDARQCGYGTLAYYVIPGRRWFRQFGADSLPPPLTRPAHFPVLFPHYLPLLIRYHHHRR